MKLSEIFRKTFVRADALPDAETELPTSEISVASLALGEAADEIIEGEEPEEIIPFQPPRPALPESYFYPDAAEAAHLHAELLRELPADHPLFGVPLETFAACDGSDDTLFRYRGNPRRLVLVHLTWLGRTEIDAYHPGIVFTGTFEEFLEREKELYGLEPPA